MTGANNKATKGPNASVDFARGGVIQVLNQRALLTRCRSKETASGSYRDIYCLPPATASGRFVWDTQ